MLYFKSYKNLKIKGEYMKKQNSEDVVALTIAEQFKKEATQLAQQIEYSLYHRDERC